MFDRLLIANRGEIACRIARTARRLGVTSLAVYSDADANAAHVQAADGAHRVGPAPAAESYLQVGAILEAARVLDAQAIHPGYGFLSENAQFAEAVEQAGLIFVGPPPSAILAMGLKDGAKRLMEQAGVPVVPGYHGDNQDPAFLAAEAERIGYPVLIKAVAGGGGKGMRRVDDPGQFEAALGGAQREAARSFGDDRVLVEKFVTQPRHVEIQVFADSHGNAVHLFERDCSLQRRHQKVIEEAPAPGMTDAVRSAMGKAAVNAALAIGYRGAGTVEFIADGSAGLRADGFFFMEMNTRLQVEHPVTEMITGQDLVEWQLRVAAGEPLPLAQDDIAITGHSVEARLYAENPAKGFLPSTGTLHRLRLPAEGDGLRVDTGVAEGDPVTMYYDPMIAKVIAHGPTRDAALGRLAGAMAATRVAGVETNAAFLARLAGHRAFRDGAIDTGFIDRHLPDLVPSGAVAPGAVALAVTALRLLDVEPGSGGGWSDPWSIRDGFRVGARQAELVRLNGPDGALEAQVIQEDGTAGGAVLAIEISTRNGEPGHEPESQHAPVRIDVGDASLGADGTLRARLNGTHAEAGILRRGATLYVMAGGATLTFTVPDPLDRDEGEGAGGGLIAAPMPGKIVSVQVSPGDRVRRGQPLVVLEAMKMEHTLSAAGDGVVEQVAVSPGDQVDEGATVVTLASA